MLVKKISVTVNKDFVHVLNPDRTCRWWGLSIWTLKADLEIPMSFFCSFVFCLLALSFTHLINAEIWPKIWLPKMSLLCNSWHTLCGIFLSNVSDCLQLSSLSGLSTQHTVWTGELGELSLFSCLFCPDFCFFNAHFTKSRIRLRFLTSLCWLRNPSLFKM